MKLFQRARAKSGGNSTYANLASGICPTVNFKFFGLIFLSSRYLAISNLVRVFDAILRQTRVRV